MTPAEVTLLAIAGVLVWTGVCLFAGYKVGSRYGEVLTETNRIIAKEYERQVERQQAIVETNTQLVKAFTQSHDNLTYGAALLFKREATIAPGAAAAPGAEAEAANVVASNEEQAKAVREEAKRMQAILTGETTDGLEDLASEYLEDGGEI